MKDAEPDPQHAGGVRDEPQGGLHPQVPQQPVGPQHPQGELRPHGELPGEEPPTKSARTGQESKGGIFSSSENIPIVFTNGKQLSSSTFIRRWHSRRAF